MLFIVFTVICHYFLRCYIFTVCYRLILPSYYYYIWSFSHSAIIIIIARSYMVIYDVGFIHDARHEKLAYYTSWHILLYYVIILLLIHVIEPLSLCRHITYYHAAAIYCLLRFRHTYIVIVTVVVTIALLLHIHYYCHYYYHLLPHYYTLLLLLRPAIAYMSTHYIITIVIGCYRFIHICHYGHYLRYMELDNMTCCH